jgi:hypothetical protein
VSKSNPVPRTEAVATGLDTDMDALVPAGGVNSTRTLPARRFMLRFSLFESETISLSVRLVRGRTVITALPTSIRALLLNPVEITVSWLIRSPVFAATNLSVPGNLSSTAPLIYFIAPSWAKAPNKVNAKKTVKKNTWIFRVMIIVFPFIL